MIFPAMPADIDAIKALAAKHTKELGFILRPALIEAGKRGELLVAKDRGGQLLGFCHYHRRRDGITTIYEICTDPAARGLGVGRKMIKHIPTRPIKLKCPEDNESNRFYEHIGCRLIGIEPGKKRKLNIWVYV